MEAEERLRSTLTAAGSVLVEPGSDLTVWLQDCACKRRGCIAAGTEGSLPCGKGNVSLEF